MWKQGNGRELGIMVRENDMKSISSSLLPDFLLLKTISVDFLLSFSITSYKFASMYSNSRRMTSVNNCPCPYLDRIGNKEMSKIVVYFYRIANE
jgi:hypothetical protein